MYPARPSKDPIMKRLLSLILFLLPALPLVAAKEKPDPTPPSKPDPQMTEDFARWLTPEKCESQPPSWSFANYFADENEAWKSEQGRDVFYGVYAEVLAKRTDAAFPEAVKFRELFSKVSAAIASFLAQSNGETVTASETTRSRAEIEWWIHHGFDENFEGGFPPDYTHDDIRQLARLYQRTHSHHVKKGRDLSGLEAKVLEPALSELEIGERGMSKEQILFFRAKVASIIVDRLGE